MAVKNCMKTFIHKSIVLKYLCKTWKIVCLDGSAGKALEGSLRIPRFDPRSRRMGRYDIFTFLKEWGTEQMFQMYVFDVDDVSVYVFWQTLDSNQYMKTGFEMYVWNINEILIELLNFISDFFNWVFLKL